MAAGVGAGLRPRSQGRLTDTESTLGAYERIVAQLRALGKRPKDHGDHAEALCPAHDDRHHYSLALWRKADRAKVVCFAGCLDGLDVLPALGMTLPDLWDNPRQRGQAYPPISEVQGRIEARRTMTPAQRGVDDLLQLPDLGERLCLGIARIRPELYIWEREGLGRP